MPTPIINEQLDALNQLIAHQNAAIDLIASDKRADLVTDVAAVAQLCKSGEILEIMDYGDEIHPEWVDGSTHYNPAMNLCHESDELLEDGETIHGAFFEWDKTIPFGMPFDAPEAIYAFDGTEGAGDHYIGIGEAYGTGWNTSKHIQITLADAPAEGDQLVITGLTDNNVDPTGGLTWTVYGAGSTTAKQTGTTSNGASGTSLGTTSSVDEHHTNVRVNALSRVIYGYNRWSQSGLRQWLNSADASFVWTPQNMWDRPASEYAGKAGFLFKYDASVIQYFKPIKVVTVACNADDNVDDVTYDRVFLSSLEQMYCEPQFSGKEGAYWEYYKRLLGRTSPAPTSQTYARLIKYALNAATSAQHCVRRSSNRTHASTVWSVHASGLVNAPAARGASRCAPSVFISD